MPSDVEKLAFDLLTGEVKAMPQFAIDPAVEESIFYRPVREEDIQGAPWNAPGGEESFLQPDDLVPTSALTKLALGLAAMGAIKPVTRIAAETVPDVVKLAQKRIVEPIVNDAVKITISPQAKNMAQESQILKLLKGETE